MPHRQSRSDKRPNCLKRRKRMVSRLRRAELGKHAADLSSIVYILQEDSLSAPPAPFTALPREPRLIRQGKERRSKTAEPVPTRPVEIIRPFYANLIRAALPNSYDGAQASRLIWTNNNLVVLESLLAGDAEYPSLEGKVDLNGPNVKWRVFTIRRRTHGAIKYDHGYISQSRRHAMTLTDSNAPQATMI